MTTGRLGGLVSGFDGYIKSIQRGTIATGGASATATITAIQLPWSIVDFLGETTNIATTNKHDLFNRVDLQDATTVRMRGHVGTTVRTISYQAVERWPSV